MNDTVTLACERLTALLIRTYYDKALHHEVNVYAPRYGTESRQCREVVGPAEGGMVTPAVRGSHKVLDIEPAPARPRT